MLSGVGAAYETVTTTPLSMAEASDSRSVEVLIESEEIV